MYYTYWKRGTTCATLSSTCAESAAKKTALQVCQKGDLSRLLHSVPEWNTMVKPLLREGQLRR